MTRKTSAEKRALAVLYRDHLKLSYREIARKCGISKSTAQAIRSLKAKPSGNVKKAGRRKLLNKRKEWMLMRVSHQLRRQYVNFSVGDLIVECSLGIPSVSRITISRYLKMGSN